MRALGGSFVVGLMMMVLAGCSGAPNTPPLAPDPPEPQGPIVIAPPEPNILEGNEDVPRSIRRLVAEQRDEVQSIRALAAELRDRRGRARALAEADDCAQELQSIEADVLATMADSERLDAVVIRLHRLETKTGLIHDALRQATL